MNKTQMKIYYERNNQPHIQPYGATFFVTMMAHDAIPGAELDRLRSERDTALASLSRYSNRKEKRKIQEDYENSIEKLLHAKKNQEYPFRTRETQAVVSTRLQQYNHLYYILDAACIMANHLHLLLDFSVQIPDDWDGISTIDGYISLATVIARIKGGITYDYNTLMKRKGTLWAKGYYDRYIRNQIHFSTVFNYIIQNPVKAGIVERWKDYPGTYIDEKWH
jgi:REP element-mobilizing transposase RayT